jgi:hypothetical protein
VLGYPVKHTRLTRPDLGKVVVARGKARTQRLEGRGALSVGHLWPRPVVERSARRRDRTIDVRLLCRSNAEEDFFGRRVPYVEG